MRLALDPPVVARLPWECLYDTRNGAFLSTTPEVTLVRYVRPAAQEPPAVPRGRRFAFFSPPSRLSRIARSGRPRRFVAR